MQQQLESPSSSGGESSPDLADFWKHFFAPLQTRDSEVVLPFPGFGFWSRDYAEFLANFTAPNPELVADPKTMCDVIAYLFQAQYGQSDQMCAPYWDNISCFPATERGKISVVPCAEYIKNVPYDTSGKNAFLDCLDFDQNALFWPSA